MYDVYVAAVAASGIPEPRPEAEVRAWIDGLVDRAGRVRGWRCATSASWGSPSCASDWLFLLFVHPDLPARGVGAALLELVKAQRPGGFGLRVHVANERARAFYRRHGLVELETTDGSDFPDQAPDVRMAWLGDDPLAYLRRRIDEVDDELAVLLARRASLTAAVQDHKDVGGRGRPRPRSRGRDRRPDGPPRAGDGPRPLARVMHAVIAESLAAWESRPVIPPVIPTAVPALLAYFADPRGQTLRVDVREGL